MSKKILLVESDVPFAGSIAGALQARGVAVAVARDAPSAIDAARAERPDGIVLCAELTGGSGFVVANKLRKDPELREIPLLITSADATAETFEQHRRLKTRADAYMRKPVQVAELLRELGGIAELPEPSAAGDGGVGEGDEDELAAFDAAFDSIAQLEGTPGPVEQPISAEDAEAAAASLGDVPHIAEAPRRFELQDVPAQPAVAQAAVVPPPVKEASQASVAAPVAALDATLQGELQSVRAELQSARGDLQSARTELESLRRELQSLRGERDAAREELERAQAARATLEQRLDAEQARQDRARDAFTAALSLLQRSGS